MQNAYGRSQAITFDIYKVHDQKQASEYLLDKTVVNQFRGNN